MEIVSLSEGIALKTLSIRFRRQRSRKSDSRKEKVICKLICYFNVVIALKQEKRITSYAIL